MRLASLRDVYEHRGPFVTLYLDTSAGATGDRWWGAIQRRLAEQGADDRTLHAIADRLAEPEPGGRVLVACGGEVLLDDELPQPASVADDAYVGPIPQLMPYLRLRGPHIPHLRVVVDDEGADITAVPPTRRPETLSVSGARPAAAEISRLAGTIHSRAIVLAGPRPQRTRVREQLTDEVGDQVVEAEIARSDRSAAGELLRAEVAGTVEAAVRARIAEAEREFEQERGLPERAVEGWEATLDALRGERVRALLWDPERTGRPAHLYIGPAAGAVATEERTLREHGGAPLGSVPADAALVRALAGTEAEFFPVDPNRLELADGIGALLR